MHRCLTGGWLLAVVVLLAVPLSAAAANTAPVVTITSPAAGEIIQDDPAAVNALLVQGTVSDANNNLRDYTIDIAPGAKPRESAYKRLNTHHYPVSGGQIGVWVFDGWTEPYKNFHHIFPFVPETGEAMGIAVNPDPIVFNGNMYFGTMYIGDNLKGLVRVFDNQGRLLFNIGSWGAGEGQLIQPFGLTIHDGALYVLSNDAGRGKSDLQKFDLATGAYLNWRIDFLPYGTMQPGDVKFGPDGTVYVLFGYPGSVMRRFDLDGTLLGETTLDPSIVSWTFAVDQDRSRLLTSMYQQYWDGGRVDQFDLSMNPLGAFAVGLDTPLGLAVRSDGNVLAGVSRHTIRIYSPEGTNLKQDLAGYYWLWDVEFDKYGDLYSTGGMYFHFAVDVPTSPAETTLAAAGTYTLRITATDTLGKVTRKTVAFTLAR